MFIESSALAGTDFFNAKSPELVTKVNWEYCETDLSQCLKSHSKVGALPELTQLSSIILFYRVIGA